MHDIFFSKCIVFEMNVEKMSRNFSLVFLLVTQPQVKTDIGTCTKLSRLSLPKPANLELFWHFKTFIHSDTFTFGPFGQKYFQHSHQATTPTWFGWNYLTNQSLSQLWCWLHLASALAAHLSHLDSGRNLWTIPHHGLSCQKDHSWNKSSCQLLHLLKQNE